MYQEFLATKEYSVIPTGMEPSEINPMLFPYQQDIVRWALRKGRAAIFSACGTGKTAMQLEVIRRGLKLWSKPGDLVLTPFLGIGSEAVVALEENRRAVGIELKQSYYNQAVKNCTNTENSKGKQASIFDLLEDFDADIA